MQQKFFNKAWRGEAIFDESGQYRYWLSRSWNSTRPIINFIMLNPSTANEEHLDSTITRCLYYAQHWGFGRLIVTNLFAWRATQPNALTSVTDPVGTDNDAYLTWGAVISHVRVAAWGTHHSAKLRKRGVEQLLSPFPLMTLGTT